ncbi:MAG: hypothetical protein ABIH72_01270 [archaeon]
MTKEDVDLFLDWIKEQELDLTVNPENFGYDNPNLILIDAVLSINRQYDSFAKPRIEKLRVDLKNTDKLKDLHELVAKKQNYFIKLWNYKHTQRAELLRKLTEFFIRYRQQNRFGSDIKAMKHWAENSGKIPVKGIGFKTTQYIRMLLGVSTVKPDVHLHRAVEKVLGKKVSDEEVVKIVEDSAKKLGLEATTLDHGIWKLKSATL